MPFTYQYPRPAYTTDALLISKEAESNYVLLIQRGIEPFKGSWALPGGFVNMDEDILTACARELEEETHLSGISLKQFYTFGAINRDPRHRTISTVFYSILNSRLPVQGGDDAANAQWFDMCKLPHLAFDHAMIIEKFRKEKL